LRPAAFLIFFSGQAYQFLSKAELTIHLTPDPAEIPLNLWELDPGSSSY